MSKFKAGDRVRAIHTGNAFVKGEEYVVHHVGAYGHIFLSNKTGGYNETCFELVDANRMPKLESGMVIEVDSCLGYTKTGLVLGETVLYSDNYGFGWDKLSTCNNGNRIKKVYSMKNKHDFKDQFRDLEDRLIWEYDADKAKIKEIKETIEKLTKQVAELESK